MLSIESLSAMRSNDKGAADQGLDLASMDVWDELRATFPDAPEQVITRAVRNSSGDLDDAYEAVCMALSAPPSSPQLGEALPKPHARDGEDVVDADNEWTLVDDNDVSTSHGGYNAQPSESSDGAAAVQETDVSHWTCMACTLTNTSDALVCLACDTSRGIDENIDGDALFATQVAAEEAALQQQLANDAALARRLDGPTRLEKHQAVTGNIQSRTAPSQVTAWEQPPRHVLDEMALELLHLSLPDQRGVPRCWSDVHGIVPLEAGPESAAVACYLGGTIGFHPEIKCIVRMQNFEVYRRLKRNAGDTIMFHGCKSEGNEKGIAFNGFQVSQCVSGGNSFGTWFAYGAAYSNSGYVHADSHGEHHIFVCVVSKRDVKLDNGTMRVVGQDCAYPLWIVTYRSLAPASMQ